MGILTPRSPWKEEYYFQSAINPRRLLTASQLDGLREVFPQAVGARVLVAGFLVVLFESLCDITQAYHQNWAMEVGGLRVVYDLVAAEVTASTIESGYEVSISPNSLQSTGCLGLRLRMTDGVDVITTVTHGFVRHPSASRLTQTVCDWILRAKSAIGRFRNPFSPRPAETPAGGISRSGNSNSPIGKHVWLATEARKVGTISRSFDQPSSVLPYPAGYRHDLSLVTDDNLPFVVSPPGYPVISGWATYSEALSGACVYAVRLNAVVGSWRALQGHVDQEALSKATVLGSQYLWEEQARSQSASLIWRTAENSSPANGWSGSVLCLGKPGDATSQAIVFQNYQIRCIDQQDFALLKAGFLLPDEIRAATVWPYTGGS